MGFKWERELEIGDSLIDSQHRELVSMYNKLLMICASKVGVERKNKEISEAIDFLIIYTVTHFSDEEELQMRCGFPGYEEHRALHEEFKQRAAKLYEVFKKVGFSEDFVTIIKSQVGLWLVTHIQTEDSKIAPYIQKNQDSQIA